MHRLAKFIQIGASCISGFVKSFIKIIARLFGIKELGNHRYDSSQLSSAIWIFILGIPVGLFFIGLEFPILIWLSIIFGLLAIVNLDEALMLTALYAEHDKYTNKERIINA